MTRNEMVQAIKDSSEELYRRADSLIGDIDLIQQITITLDVNCVDRLPKINVNYVLANKTFVDRITNKGANKND